MLVALPLAIPLAKKFKLMDVPYSAPHKTHDHPVPRAGGMAFAVVLALILLAGGHFMVPAIRAILGAALVVFIFGLVDDALGLSAPWKLLGQTLATIILVSQGVSIQMLRQPALDLPLTFIWIIGITNAFNFVDSMDGLAVGLSAIASAFFMLVTWDAGQAPLAYLSAAILGASIGMAWFNIMPARSFLGDSGAQLLGFLLAAIGIAYTPPGLPQPSSWFVPVLLLSIPIFDMVLVVFSRLRRQASLIQGSQDHTYHRLVKLGLAPSQAIMTMHTAAILTGCLAFMALPLAPLWANVIFAGSLVVGLFAFVILQRQTGR
jgi:UDP-GlcNAc:undecaprenyl-phosphate GlcNAc-1-phosphate transferase